MDVQTANKIGNGADAFGLIDAPSGQRRVLPKIVRGSIKESNATQAGHLCTEVPSGGVR
jgi:hypothetical protein